MAKENAWYNLDNAANIYPAISNDRNTNVFRLSCTLHENVKPLLLSQALKEAMTSFPYFQVVMRRGLFWYYLESTDIEPEVTIESHRPCKRLFYKSEKELLFRMTYYGPRINLEVFHAVADGGGANELLRTTIYHYLLLAYPDTLGANPPRFKTAATPPEQAEDGFFKHYLPKTVKPHMNPKSFTLTGTSLPANSIKIITARMSTKEILALVKSKNATLTAYLTALMFCAIYEEQVPRRHANKEIGITIPVDLRNLFSSETARNFFSVIEVRYNFQGKPIDFDNVLHSVTEQLQDKVTEENLSNLISNNMNLSQNIFARMVPLFIKNFILKTAYRINEGSSATTISNMGRVVMPKEFEEYIDNFSCLLNPTTIQKVKLTIISYNDVLKLNFTSTIAETSIQRYFIRHLAEQGIDITITTNGGEY